MEIKQIRGVKKDNDRVVYVILGDEAIRFLFNLGAEIPDISLMTTTQVADEMTAYMGQGWESFTAVSTPTHEQLGDAPTGRIDEFPETE